MPGMEVLRGWPSPRPSVPLTVIPFSKTSTVQTWPLSSRAQTNDISARKKKLPFAFFFVPGFRPLSFATARLIVSSSFTWAAGDREDSEAPS